MGLKIRVVKNGFSFYGEYKLGQRGVVYEKIEARNKRQAKKLYAARLKQLRAPDPARKTAEKTKPNANYRGIPSRTILALNVLRLRKAADMSQESLPASAKIDRTYISQIERGNRNVSIDVVDALARSLGARTPDLLSSEKDFS